MAKDHSGLCVSLERQGHHMQLNVRNEAGVLRNWLTRGGPIAGCQVVQFYMLLNKSMYS